MHQKVLLAPFTCPSCGVTIETCRFCENIAEYEGWSDNSGGLIQKIKVCEEHARKLRGWKKFQEKEE